MKLLLLLSIIIYWYSAKAAEVETSPNPSFIINPERSITNIERRVEAEPINAYRRLGRANGKSFKNFIRINRGDAPGSSEEKTSDFFIRLGKRSYATVPGDEFIRYGKRSDYEEDNPNNDVLDYWGRYGLGDELEYRELDPKFIRFSRSNPSIRLG